MLLGRALNDTINNDRKCKQVLDSKVDVVKDGKMEAQSGEMKVPMV